MIPREHLLQGIDVFVTAALTDLHDQLKPFYSDIGRPSIDPELLIRMHLVGYCSGIRSERKLSHYFRWIERQLSQKLLAQPVRRGGYPLGS
jgi:transposase